MINHIRQYSRIAFRNMLKYKAQSFTAIFGLVFGIICFVPALCWLHYETSYDDFYPDSENIYRIYSVDKGSGKVNERVPGILGRKLLEQFAALDASTDFVIERLDYQFGQVDPVSLGTICADSSFFRVFPQKSITGNLEQALQVAGSMILTETAALRLFGSAEKAMGQQLENSLSRIFGPCTVTAVVEDQPSDTNLPFDAILNFPAIQDASMIMPEAEQWSYFNNTLYVKTHPHVHIDELAGQIRDFTSRTRVNADIELKILPISDVRYHLDTNLPFTLNFIRLLVAAGILLIVSALFNFINLHFGLFHRRVHEFRQRLIHGATHVQVLLQMLFELSCSLLLVLLLGAFALFLIRPLFTGLLGISIPAPLFIDVFLFCALGIVALALLISAIPCRRLIGWIAGNLSERKTTRQTLLQQVAVSLQLAVSIVFIVAVSIIMMQMHFVSRKDLGFDRNGIIQLYSTESKLENNREALMHELETIPDILSVSTTSFEPEQNAKSYLMTSEVEWPGKQAGEKPVFQWIPVGSKFAETFRLDLLMGKWWNEGEKGKIVLNEEAVRVMGLDDPVGSIVRMTPFMISSDGVAPMEEYEVAGVVKDFHSLSLRSSIYPAILKPGMEDIWYLRVVPGREEEVIRRVSAILPKVDVRLSDSRMLLLDTLYDRLNYSEQVGLKLFSVLAVVCLLISLFGIYAVVTATTQRRRKEIAIRKIVGADETDIIGIFFRTFTAQVLIACLVALPLGCYLMYRWLRGYAYHTDIPLWLPVAILAGVMAVVLSTVLGQILKAAKSNPSEVVKSP